MPVQTRASAQDELPRKLLDAQAWDNFRGLCYAMRPFERDDPEYREARAVQRDLREYYDQRIEKAQEQLAFADRVLLNKVDLVPEEAELKKIEDRIKVWW